MCVLCRLKTTVESNKNTASTLWVCTHTCARLRKIKTKWGRWGVSAHTYDITSMRRWPALLTLPFALVAGEASVGGGVVSLGLRRRPFSWPLTPTKEPSFASARFLARSVFHDRDFLYGTGTRNINQPIREKRGPVESGCRGNRAVSEPSVEARG